MARWTHEPVLHHQGKMKKWFASIVVAAGLAVITTPAYAQSLGEIAAKATADKATKDQSRHAP